MRAIPTKYEGVNFRSRLEARWAALFDLAGWSWSYEPFDLSGWAPDFAIHTKSGDVLVEVKPVALKWFDNQFRTLPDDPSFAKAKAHWPAHWILLLGQEPQEHSDLFSIGRMMDPPSTAECNWMEMNDALCLPDSGTKWRTAGNKVQWRRVTPNA
ncbi:MAG: hypothetical protein ACPGFA_01260 [Pikeienuella sp.]